MKYSIKKLILLAFVLCIGDCLMADRPVVNVSRSNGELVVVSSGPFGIIKDTYVGYKFVEQSSTDETKQLTLYAGSREWRDVKLIMEQGTNLTT